MNYFNEKCGEGHVQRHRYSISTKDGNSLVQANNWDSVVKKGTVLVMSMNWEKVALGQEEYMSGLLRNRSWCDAR